MRPQRTASVSMTLMNQVLDLETAEHVSLAQLPDAVNGLTDGVPPKPCYRSPTYNFLDVPVQ